MSPRRFRYQDPQSPQTLREGLEEYQAGHAELFAESTLAGEALELFHRHDLCHVIFGLDTVPRDEVRADLWTLMATDVGYRRYSGYLRLPEAKAAFKSVPVWTYLGLTFQAASDTGRIFARTRRLSAKLSWERLDDLLDRPLRDLRAEYGIAPL